MDQPVSDSSINAAIYSEGSGPRKNLVQLFLPFVNNPALIALPAGLFFGTYVLLRNRAWAQCHRINALLVAASAWLGWAIWEWAVMTFSPEANIRVDLLLLIPLVAIASITAIVLLFVPQKNKS